jgi:hypothetical protein
LQAVPAQATTLGVYSKTAKDMNLSARKLDKMIEEATVDCYDELEQASGFYTMIEDHLACSVRDSGPWCRGVGGWCCNG